MCSDPFAFSSTHTLGKCIIWLVMEKTASVLGFPHTKAEKISETLKRKYGYIKTLSLGKNRDEDVELNVHNPAGIAFVTLNLHLCYFELCLFKIF